MEGSSSTVILVDEEAVDGVDEFFCLGGDGFIYMLWPHEWGPWKFLFSSPSASDGFLELLFQK